MDDIVPLYVDFSGILYSTYLTLRDKWVSQSWQYFYAIGVSEWWVMESSDAHRIHSKEKMLFHAKNVFFVHILTDILFVYHYFALFWQNKNENSSSNLLHVCCFGFHPQLTKPEEDLAHLVLYNLEELLWTYDSGSKRNLLPWSMGRCDWKCVDTTGFSSRQMCKGDNFMQ